MDTISVAEKTPNLFFVASEKIRKNFYIFIQQRFFFFFVALCPSLIVGVFLDILSSLLFFINLKRCQLRKWRMTCSRSWRLWEGERGELSETKHLRFLSLCPRLVLSWITWWRYNGSEKENTTARGCLFWDFRSERVKHVPCVDVFRPAHAKSYTYGTKCVRKCKVFKQFTL